MVAGVFAEPGFTSHPFPGGIHLSGARARPDRFDDGPHARDGQLGRFFGQLRCVSYVDQAAHRRLILAAGGADFEEYGVAVMERVAPPRRMLLAQAPGRAYEGTETGILAPRENHGPVTFGGDLVVAGAVVDGLDGRHRAGIGGVGGLAGAVLLERRLDEPEVIDEAGGVVPLRLRQRSQDPFGVPRSQEEAALFHAETCGREPEALQRPDDVIRRLLAVGMAVEIGVGDQVLDRDALHRPSHQDRPAIAGNDQDVAGEESPMVQAGEIVDVLGYGNDQAVESAHGHGLTDVLQPGRELFGGKYRAGGHGGRHLQRMGSGSQRQGPPSTSPYRRSRNSVMSAVQGPRGL